MKKGILICVSLFLLAGCASNGLPPLTNVQSVVPPLPTKDTGYYAPADPGFIRAKQRQAELLRHNTAIQIVRENLQAVKQSPAPAPPKKYRGSLSRLNRLEKRLKKVEQAVHRNAAAHQRLKNRVGVLETKVEHIHPGVKIFTEPAGFGPGGGKLQKKDFDLLKKVIKKIKEGYKIKKIIGIADPYGGTAEKNLALARQRAEVIFRYLKKKNVDLSDVNLQTEVYQKKFCNNRRWVIILER